MDEFDPDDFLKETGSENKDFDPDAFLSGSPISEEKGVSDYAVDMAKATPEPPSPIMVVIMGTSSSAWT